MFNLFIRMRIRSYREKLKYLVHEISDPNDLNADLWDSWDDYIRYIEYDIEEQEIQKLIVKFKLDKKQIRQMNIIQLTDYKTSTWLEYDPENLTYNYIRDIEEWAYDQTTSDMEDILKIPVEDIYNGFLECTLNDLNENPGKVYHYTTEERWELIKASGFLKGSRGTGITNRQEFGVFTSVDPQEHATGAYGNVCLEIDLTAFKTEQGIAVLNLSYETDIKEHLCRELLFHRLGLELRTQPSSDMSESTIIVNHTIPLKYIRQI